MIKVLFFIETLGGGGAEKVLCDLVNHMDKTKFDITVQTLWPYETDKRLADGIRYRSVYPSNSRFNRLRMRIESALGLTYRLHMKDDYDIECAYLEMVSTKIIASSNNRKAKKLAWVHCDLLKIVDDPKEFARKTESWYSKFDRVVCVSKGVKKSFDSLFNNRFPSEIIYNVVDDDTILKKSRGATLEPIPTDEPVVIAVGRLSVPKNYLRLLKAHQRILREGIRHQLWIIGEGPERTKMERFVTEQGLHDTVHMPGFRDNPYAYMRRADIVACSSSYEGFSTATTEAVILGKPIVATDCYGMKEILGDSEYGLITKNNDEAFYEGLKKLLEDRELRKMYEEKASIRGRSFSASELSKRTEQFLFEIHGDPAQHPLLTK